MPKKQPIYRDLGELLRKERMRQGLTVRELAKKVGISHPTVYKYESGEYEPRISHLKWIAETLNIPLIKLVERI